MSISHVKNLFVWVNVVQRENLTLPVLELDKPSMPCVIDTFIVFYESADLKNREQQQKVLTYIHVLNLTNM